VEEIVASGRTPAERLLELYHGSWGGSVLPAFRTCVF
jgi:glutamate--cysteine ligase